jgi:hypothetical protein
VKQIKLTEKHIQGFMAADEEMAKIYGANVDNSDPKVKAQGEAVAKKNGFASLAEHDDVSMNIAIIMSGIDQQTRTFTEPPERVREEIAALKADKSVSDEAKKEDLAQLEAALKGAKPIQFKESTSISSCRSCRYWDPQIRIRSLIMRLDRAAPQANVASSVIRARAGPRPWLAGSGVLQHRT